jgi:hypothetical protein
MPKLPGAAVVIPPGSMIESEVVSSSMSKPNVQANALPPFIAMPQSLTKLTNRIGNSGALLQDADNEILHENYQVIAFAYKLDCSGIISKGYFKDYYPLLQLPLPSDEMAASVNEMTLLSFQPIATAENSQSLSLQQNEKRQSLPDNLPSLAPIQGMETSLKALAEASNITLEALEAAILLRQQQLLKKQQGPTTIATTTTTSTLPPLKK